MKRVFMLALAAGLTLACFAPEAGAQESQPRRVTLYGPLARNHDSSRALYSFKTASYGADWDLNYGSLYVGAEHDWLQVSAAKGVRSAIRDLGAYEWDDVLSVTAVEPFPLLKPGEQRRITVDASGADGADGAPGEPGAPGDDGAHGDVAYGSVRTRPVQAAPPRPAAPRRPKHDGVPKVDPIFARAVVGHMYVLRVVDDGNDFYVLFRVESLARGDNCTITWKRIPPPLEPARRK